MKTWPWVPPWIAIRSNVCGRFDCSELRVLGRRYCEVHAAEWDELCKSLPEEEKVIWLEEHDAKGSVRRRRQ